MKPLTFQQKAIDELISSFKNLWAQSETKLPIVFKSPTGSGKTFMTSAFINEMTEQPDWDADIAWIWITFSDDLAMQSRDKFAQYFSQNLKNQLITVADFNQGKLNKNDVLFLNWQKLVSTKAEDRLLRRPENPENAKESGCYFEDVIEATHKDSRQIIMIIDESHKNVTEAAYKNVIDPANPRIIVNVSATPKEIPDASAIKHNKAAFVEVEHADVVEEGLIKERIQCQAREDIKKLGNTDLDEALIVLAMNKKAELEAQFARLNKNVNPLVLIQLPNDDKKLIEAGQETKEQIVLKFLHEKGIDDSRIALWFDGNKKNMEFISDNDCPVDYMLFKEAAGTGWDCPRAHILVMFREINSPTFKTQTIGRILRMPEPERKDDYAAYPDLRCGYLYTNYDRNQVEAAKWGDKNKPEVYISHPLLGYEYYDFNGLLQADYLSRTDYGDLVDAKKFQMSFMKSFDEFFNLQENDSIGKCIDEIKKKNIEEKPTLNYELIVDKDLTDYDTIFSDIRNANDDELLKHEMSRNDIEKLFNYHCVKVLLQQQDEDTKIGNAARSWGPLKSALRMWFRKRLHWGGTETFVADMQKGDASIFHLAIYKALKDFAPVKQKLLDEKTRERKHNSYTFMIQNDYSYTEDFEEMKVSKSLLSPFYIRKDNYNGKKNETSFINFIEKLSNVDWWYKNGDKGQNNYGFQYIDAETGKECLFYPDWIIRYKDGTIGIYDTKAGTTAIEAKDRAESLYRKLIELNSNLVEFEKNPSPKQGSLFNGEYPKIKKFVGGIVVNRNGTWFCNSSENYEYQNDALSSDWKIFI